MKLIRVYKLLFFFVFLFNQGWTQTNIPPELVAIGDQIYCPLSQINIVTDFDIIDPDDVELDILKILISEGYLEGEDVLTLVGSLPNAQLFFYQLLNESQKKIIFSTTQQPSSSQP